MNKTWISLLLAGTMLAASPVWAIPVATPVTTDSRIKTFVYSETEVFPITINYGYQSFIEFAKGEEIQTIAIGSSFAIQATPLENRLFLKALEADAHTNMVIITNKHTYQFDVQTTDPDKDVDKELAYTVRFFYPNSNMDYTTVPTAPLSQPVAGGGMMAPRPQAFPGMPGSMPGMMPPPPPFTPMPSQAALTPPRPTPSPAPAPVVLTPPPVSNMPKRVGEYNYNYTLTGPDALAPVKVYDDGKVTYLEFANPSGPIPDISSVGPTGRESPMQSWRQGKQVIVGGVAEQLKLRSGKDVVNVYNEDKAQMTSWSK